MGVYELNLEGSGKNHFYITDTQHRIIMQNDPHFNHTTILFAHFMGGYYLPPFIIYKALSNEPKDIHIITQSKDVFYASNQSGCMTEDMFILWSLFVLAHASLYRQRFLIEQNETIYLFVGHGSRASQLLFKS